jgi:hypothetical protein
MLLLSESAAKPFRSGRAFNHLMANENEALLYPLSISFQHLFVIFREIYANISVTGRFVAVKRFDGETKVK